MYFNAMKCTSMQWNVLQCNKMQWNAMKCNSIQTAHTICKFNMDKCIFTQRYSHWICNEQMNCTHIFTICLNTFHFNMSCIIIWWYRWWWYDISVRNETLSLWWKRFSNLLLFMKMWKCENVDVRMWTLWKVENKSAKWWKERWSDYYESLILNKKKEWEKR